jgi:hypothetical protein
MPAAGGVDRGLKKTERISRDSWIDFDKEGAVAQVKEAATKLAAVFRTRAPRRGVSVCRAS